MKYKVTEITFDFDDGDYDNPPTDEYKQSIIDLTLDTVWDVNDEEDLVDTITNATGWCIESIDYVHVLS